MPSAECLYDHVRPKVPGAWDGIRMDSDTGLSYFMTRCPGHADGKRSLKVSQGRQRRIVWYCHAGCTERKVRDALVELGVHPECLPRAAADMRDLTEELDALLTSDIGSAAKVLRALALLRSPGGKLPRGADLEALADAAGISRREAFRARSAGTSPTTK